LQAVEMQQQCVFGIVSCLQEDYRDRQCRNTMKIQINYCHTRRLRIRSVWVIQTKW